jgi:hypothetical protein
MTLLLAVAKSPCADNIIILYINSLTLSHLPEIWASCERIIKINLKVIKCETYEAYADDLLEQETDK